MVLDTHITDHDPKNIQDQLKDNEFSTIICPGSFRLQNRTRDGVHAIAYASHHTTNNHGRYAVCSCLQNTAND